MARMRASTSSNSSALTRSVLLRRMTSAKAIWFFASGASLSRSLSHLASATVTTASSRVLRLDILVDKKGLGDRRRIGEPGRLDDDRVELALAFHQALDDADEVAAHGAADAAVVHLEDFFVRPDDQIVVDADFAEFVDDDGVFLAVRFAQDAVQQGRLARAEIAGEDRDGNFILGRYCVHRTSPGMLRRTPPELKSAPDIGI